MSVEVLETGGLAKAEDLIMNESVSERVELVDVGFPPPSVFQVFGGKCIFFPLPRGAMYRFYSYLLTAECAMCFLLVLISFLPRVARNPIKHIISKLDMPYGGQVVLLLMLEWQKIDGVCKRKCIWQYVVAGDNGCRRRSHGGSCRLHLESAEAHAPRH